MSPSDRLPWAEARRRAAEAAPRLGTERVALHDAVGRVLRRDVVAAVDIPHYASAAMDGWAVSGTPPWTLGAATTLRAGESVEIVTGAVIPTGADRVVRHEDGRIADGMLDLVRHGERDHIRPAAAEARAGETLLDAGTRLSPAALAVAASATVDDLEVAVVPRVAFVLTGDEVVLSGVPGPGRVRDSFGVPLPAIVEQFGGEVTRARRIGDDLTATRKALDDAADTDLVVTTGGTGGSHADHVRRALDDLGAEYLVPGIAARPGGPTLLARLPDGRLVLGLPGNPLAAMLGLLSLGEVVLAGYTGRAVPPLLTLPVPSSVMRHPQATRLVPVRDGLDSNGHREVAWTGSAMMRGLAAATGVLVVPPQGAAQLLPLPWG